MSKHSLVLVQYQDLEMSFTDDGWFNATIAAERFGKRPIDWLRLPDTIRYVDALERKYEVGKSHFVKTRRGGDTSKQGTWLHPKLGVSFARWLDVDFAIWCDEQIDTLIRGQHPHHDWKQARAESKLGRRVETDAIKVFVEYAKSQGSTHAEHYYSNLTKMTYKALFLVEQGLKLPKHGLRDLLSGMELSFLTTAEYVCTRALQEGMRQELRYPAIYELARDKVEHYAVSIGRCRLSHDQGGMLCAA